MTDKFCVIYSPSALDDLRAIYSYIAYELKSAQAAINQTNRIRKQVRSLDSMPRRYSKVDWDPWASMGMHKLPVDNYAIYYLVDDDSLVVTIIRIFYGGRDIKGIIQSEITKCL